MTIHKWSDLKRERVSEERVTQIRSEVEREVLEMNLASVRELIGKNQTEVAAAMGMAQSEVSRSEHRTDHLVSTLREYVRALGGELELTARFGDKSIRLRGV
jgi:DNA-directed RNA polymerase specialized sigma subunit